MGIMLVDNAIQNIKKLIDALENLRKKEKDPDNFFLFGALRNILRYAMVNLAIFYCKEMQNKKILEYRTKQNNFIRILIDREFLDRSIRRLLLLDSWGQFELYFSSKVKNSEKMLTKKIVDSYYKNFKTTTPKEIDFFREIRNCLHGNGIYNKNKEKFDCLVNNKLYSLIPGKKVEFVHYDFLLCLIDTAINEL